MYAVIESGGKQYRVQLGAEIQVDHLEAGAGDSITFDRVLLVAGGDTAAVGQPHVAGAVVSAQVVSQDRGDKIVVFKYRPKARRRVKKGFRAALTTLRISDITYDGQSAAKLAAQEAQERERSERAAQKAAAEKAAADQALAARLAADLDASGSDEGTALESPPKGAQGRRARGVAADVEPAATSQASEALEPAATTEPEGSARTSEDDAPNPGTEAVSAAQPAEDSTGSTGTSPGEEQGGRESPSPATGKDT